MPRSKPSTKASHKGCAPQIRALKMKYPELGPTAIARTVGCTPDNVSQVLRRSLGNYRPADLKEYQAYQADIIDSVAMRSIASITDAKLDKSPAVALGTLAAIMIDKSRLIKGQATGINVTVLMDVAEAIRARRAAGPVVQVIESKQP